MNIGLIAIVLVASAIQFVFGYYKGVKNGVIEGYYAAKKIDKVMQKIKERLEAEKGASNG